MSGKGTPKAKLVIIDFNHSIPDTSFGATTFLQLPEYTLRFFLSDSCSGKQVHTEEFLGSEF
jgi:hypothetical protein